MAEPWSGRLFPFSRSVHFESVDTGIAMPKNYLSSGAKLDYKSTVSSPPTLSTVLFVPRGVGELYETNYINLGQNILINKRAWP